MPAGAIKILSGEDNDADLFAFALDQAPDRAYDLRRARALKKMHDVPSRFCLRIAQAVPAPHDAPILALTGKGDGEPRRSRSGAWKRHGTGPKTLIMEILA
jgi:hypothetical protein